MSHENLQELIDYRYPPLEAATLVAPVQASEIKEALFFMPTNKAPGPDGFPMEFYKVAWSIIGKDFIKLSSPSSCMASSPRASILLFYI